MEEAIQWMQLKAMQAGAIPPDAVFLDRLFQKLHTDATEAAQHDDPIAQLNAERSLVSDFSGLKDVSEETKKLAALKQSAALKAALKWEKESIADQASLIQDVSAKLARLEDVEVNQRLALRTDILDGMTGLKQQAARSKNDERRQLLLRAFNSLWVQGLESGQAQFEQKHWDKAESYFQLISQVSPDDPWPPLLLAETRTAMGDKKQAIKDLKESVRRGLKNPEVLEKDAKLQALRSEAEYRKIVEELKGK
jgi:predicted Zn-dependent protease